MSTTTEQEEPQRPWPWPWRKDETDETDEENGGQSARTEGEDKKP